MVLFMVDWFLERVFVFTRIILQLNQTNMTLKQCNFVRILDV